MPHFGTRDGIQSRRGKRKENDESIELAQQCSSANSQRTSTGLLAACPIAQAVDPPQERSQQAAIFVSPLHEAQTVRGDDGKDHLEYELLVVNAVD